MSGIKFLAIAVAVLCVLEFASAGCGPHHKRVNAMCCPGRNNTCVAHGARMNHKHANTKRCYCDEDCLRLGDCCTDYPNVCEAQDCVLGEWGEYSECDRTCGMGTSIRKRPILVPTKNGGKECDARIQKRTCFGRRCKTQRGLRHKVQRETARIIPGNFGRWRSDVKYDISKDIRKNLFFHYTYGTVDKRPTYSATFRITNTRKSCLIKKPGKLNWSNVLTKGSTICVECQQVAMDKATVRCKGHGVHRMETRWNAVNAIGCHGKWELVEYHQERNCGKGARDFIFV